MMRWGLGQWRGWGRVERNETAVQEIWKTFHKGPPRPSQRLPRLTDRDAQVVHLAD